MGTANGTEIEDAASQKLGFYGATPITQRSNTAGDTAQADGTYSSNEQKMLNDCYGTLRALGLLELNPAGFR